MATKLKTFNGSRFTNKVVLADIEFIPLLELIDQLATDNGLIIFVTSSARLFGAPLSGIVIPPASRSNHLIGHAIDMNIQMGSKFFNGDHLSNSQFSLLPSPVQNFINSIRSHPILRWGGDFNDPVHIDDGLNLRAPSIWDEKFEIIQTQLSGLTQPGTSADGKRLLSLQSPILQGDDVKAVQTKLIELGFDVGSTGADGLFGAATAKAVIEFQTQKNLNPIDGIVGSATKAALGL
jgi:Putative peptidoglycan binding domain/D-alanyl-D-alanine carboxypeptidase